MSKTSRKSASKAVPKNKPVAASKRTSAASKTSKSTRKKSTKVTSASKATTKSSVVRAKTVKKVTKKTSSNKDKVSVKKAPVKSATTVKKPATSKKPSRPTTKQTPVRKAKTQKKAATSKSVEDVVLPTRMSIRVREKVLVLADTFEKDFYYPGLTLAKAGGLCFLLVGSVVTYTQLSHVNPFGDACLDGSCTVAQVSGATDADLAATDQERKVELLSDVPSIINESVGIPMQITSAETVRAYLRHISTGGSTQTNLAIESIGNDKYEVTIDPANLAPNQYELIVSVKHSGSVRNAVYSLGYFAIVDDTISSSDTQSATNSTNDTASQTSVPDTVASSTTTSTASGVPNPTDNVSYKKPVPEISSEDQSPNRDEAQSDLANSETEPPLQNDQVSKRDALRITTDTIVSNIATVRVAHAQPKAVVSFFIRPLQTLNTQTIGQMIPGTGIFRFDSTQFPNGQYQLYAEHQLQGVASTSNPVQFIIQNTARDPRVKPLATSTDRELFDITNEYPQDGLARPQAEVGANPVTFNVRDKARTALAADREALDDLFQRYAVAVQSGDPALIAEASKAIEVYREALVFTALGDERDRLFAKELDAGLAIELQALATKVETFESVRRERTESASATDTDGDGISDFDEVNLYNTDPTLADTDNDGFTDGAEIIRGFNPNDSAAEAAIAYQSPKESVGVIRTEKLQVNEVVPETELPAGGATGNVRAVVRGIGLPNSFVTLYMYSTPTIVTVRTEADGSFEYTFSKELEDGQHEVFVALTDNTGAIVAQSAAFTFVKEAQAFTPVDAQEVVTALAASNTSDQSPYRLVLGMSVLALGILLVLLGIGLRGNKPDTVFLDDKTV